MSVPKLKGAPKTYLTPRQRQITRMVARGMSRGEVCEELHIGIDTMREHCYRIFRVVGVKTSVQLAAWYWQRQLEREYRRGYADGLAATGSADRTEGIAS